MVNYLEGLFCLNYGLKQYVHELIQLSLVVVTLKYRQICSTILYGLRMEQC